MMIFFGQLLLLALATITTAIANGQPQQQMIYSPQIYSPADGFYRCRQEGAKCLVTGCESGGCSILENGFEKEMTEFGKSIYKSTRPGASLSIVVAKDITATTTEVSCDGACACQWITSDIGGCVPAPPKVVSAVSTTNTNGQQEAEKEGTTISNITPTVTQSILIGVLIPLFVIFVAGMIWYGMRRRRRQQQQEKEEDNKLSSMIEIDTDGGDSVNDDDDDDDDSYRVTPPPRFQIKNGDNYDINDTATGPNSYCGADNFDECESVELGLKYDSTCHLYESASALCSSSW